MTPETLFPHALVRHVKVARMLGDTLTLGAPEDWDGFTIVARCWLTADERRRLAWAALVSCGENSAREVVAACFPEDEEWNEHPRPGMPNRDGLLEDADWWAKRATRREREAYALASLSRKAPDDRAALLRAFAEGGA
jgi:hypothetical protein